MVAMGDGGEVARTLSVVLPAPPEFVSGMPPFPVAVLAAWRTVEFRVGEGGDGGKVVLFFPNFVVVEESDIRNRVNLAGILGGWLHRSCIGAWNASVCAETRARKNKYCKTNGCETRLEVGGMAINGESPLPSLLLLASGLGVAFSMRAQVR